MRCTGFQTASPSFSEAALPETTMRGRCGAAGKAPGSRRLIVAAAEVAALPGARASGSGSWPRLALRLHLYLINAGGCLASLTLDVLVLGERLQPLGTGSFIPPALLSLLPDSPPGLTSGAAP